MSLLEARRTMVTADDQGALITIGAWLAMVISCLAVLTRLGSKFLIARRVGLDDALISASMLAVLGQTIAVSLQVSHGLGKRMEKLTGAEIDGYQQASYASQMLYFPSLALAKCSIVVYVTQMMPLNYIRAIRILIGSIVLWTVVGMIAVAFQCQFPSPWAVLNVAKCFDQKVFWIVMGAFDIITEGFIVGFPVSVIWKLQMRRSLKAVVIAAFACRILVVPVIVLRLKYISEASTAVDRTFADFNTVMTTAVDLNLCIFVSCVPYLKPFMEGLPAGCLTGKLQHRLRLGGAWKGDSYALESGSGNDRDRTRHISGPTLDENNNKVTVTAAPASINVANDSDSRTSLGSDKMIIKQTRGWTVHYDEEHTDGHPPRTM